MGISVIEVLDKDSVAPRQRNHKADRGEYGHGAFAYPGERNKDGNCGDVDPSPETRVEGRKRLHSIRRAPAFEQEENAGNGGNGGDSKEDSAHNATVCPD